MSFAGGSLDGKKRWKAEDIKLETDGGEVVLIAPCGERRNISPADARTLALRLKDLAGVAERERGVKRQERMTKHRGSLFGAS